MDPRVKPAAGASAQVQERSGFADLGPALKDFGLDAALAALSQAALAKPRKLAVLVCASEAESQDVEHGLRELWGAKAVAAVAAIPGFVQSGVFRYESSRRVIARRLGAVGTLREPGLRFLVTSLAGLLRICPDPDWLRAHEIAADAGGSLDQDQLIEALALLSYQTVQRVEEPGEVAIRGGIVDLWTPGQRFPARLEFVGDAVEAIRSFRPADQRSFQSLDSLRILPSREFLWPADAEMEAAIERFNHFILGQGLGGSVRADLLENLRERVPFPGIDDLSYAFTEKAQAPLWRTLESEAEKGDRELEFVAMSGSAALREAWVELERTYAAGEATAGGKTLVSRIERVFPNSGELRARLAGGGAGVREGGAQALAEGALRNTALERLLKGAGLRKLADRARWIAEHALAPGGYKDVVLLCRSRETFLDLSAVLPKFVAGASAAAEAAELPEWDIAWLNKVPEAALSLGGGLRAALARLRAGFPVDATRTLYLGEDWLLGTGRAIPLDTDADAPEDGEDETRINRAAAEALMAAQFSEFAEGDLVVHVQHGIARFRGIVTVRVQDITGDFLALEYAGGDKVYVPVHKLNQVQRYIGTARKDDDSVVDSLKGTSWEKKRTQAKQDAEKLARELMEHNAKRATTPGHAFSKPDENFLSFEAAFPYDETPDQLKSVREIMLDMSKPKSMDRLLCGDVGFGKTEVAMRAAYRCVLDGKQVGWLVPTTVLAHQHLRSLRERFAEFGVSVDILDRSVGGGQSKALLALKEGRVDVVVGTHRMLSKDVEFRDLGLLVVDEEQRFGVVQKEQIKNMSYGVDVLTMTATPIPRTLQMAMLGLRDLSLLTTPPKSRLSVKTFVCPFDEAIVTEAVGTELARGGQVFFVHNRVEELPTIREYLAKLIPGARICVGHGQMGQKELDRTVIEFLDGKHDIMLCTTIIESGIDMPNVNTIVVQNADRFGLAQLYQLRGRVGRRSSRGYCYLLTSPDLRDEDDGAKRLEVLREHQELGSGFVVASHDLELRGAGNILGDDQSGRVNEVGLETYTQMLDDAIRALGGIKVRSHIEAEINAPFTTTIPEDYIGNAKERLRTYRKFFGARSEAALQALVAECEDRFGPLPEETKRLAELARVRRYLLSVGAISLTIGEDVTEIRFSREVLQGGGDDETSQAFVRRLLDVCNRQSRSVRMTPDGRILVSLRKKNFEASFENSMGELKRVLSLIAGEANAFSQK